MQNCLPKESNVNSKKSSKKQERHKPYTLCRYGNVRMDSDAVQNMWALIQRPNNGHNISMNTFSKQPSEKIGIETGREQTGG